MKKKRKKRLSKQGKIIIALAAAVVVLVCVAIVVFVSINKNKPQLKNKKFTFEYGQEVNLSKLKILDKDYEIKKLSCDFKFKDENKYPEVGKYKLTGYYTYYNKKIEFSVPVEIKDTTAPKVVDAKEEITVRKGEADYNFSNDFVAEDLSEFEISFDLAQVDFNTPGSYTAKAIFTDIYKNKTEKAFTVVIDESAQPSSGLTYVRGILVVNKKHGLPDGYNPGENPEAGDAVRRLIAAAREEGLDIGDYYSGFRSYQRQSELYWNYVSRDGQAAADTYSARPGFSEHQTGLAFDLCHSGGGLIEDDAESEWVAQNAHRFGFIVRYTPGNQHITGYVPEAWHVRYVGELATDIYNSGLCLEEYLGVEGGESY